MSAVAGADLSVAAAHIAAGDACAELLGIGAVRARSGEAIVTMDVRQDMLNTLGICHGGIVFTLADTALAYATNADGHATVTTTSSITFITPARAGDTLTATASLDHLVRRSGLVDVEVTNQDGELVAAVRGTTLRTGEPTPTTEGA